MCAPKSKEKYPKIRLLTFWSYLIEILKVLLLTTERTQHITSFGTFLSNLGIFSIILVFLVPFLASFSSAVLF